jgi:hypothetical protein
VVETKSPKGVMRITYTNSQEIQKTIRERANLFFYDCSSDKLIRDVEWLKKLEVREIDYIEATYKLEDITRIVKDSTTACILQNTQMNLYTWILYVTPDPDKFDISEAICQNICISPKWMELSYFNLVLTTSLSSLERKGYPVDRALQSKSENVAKKCEQQSKQLLESVKLPIIVTPETTQNLRSSLQNAVKTCHSNFGSAIHSQARISILKESQSSYCDVIPGKYNTITFIIISNTLYLPFIYFIFLGHSLFCVGTRQGIELYDPKGFNQSEILSQSNSDPLNRFIIILKDLANAFGVSPQAIHIFYDNCSNSIAFNRDRTLFFNLKFYIGLHDNECKIKPTINAMVYWYMTFCHELAHNFILNHSSEHEVSTIFFYFVLLYIVVHEFNNLKYIIF